jgi:hypothetical protein
MDPNPYAAPKSDFNTGTDSGQAMFWRSGALLMARNGAVLPPRCVKCNAPIDGSAKQRRFSWHHPALFLIILLNILIYAIVAIVVRKNVVVTLGLCQAHRRRRFRGILAGVAGIFLSVGFFIASGMAEQPNLVLAGLVVLVVSIVVIESMARTLSPARIADKVGQLKGCGEAFLASLPTS